MFNDGHTPSLLGGARREGMSEQGGRVRGAGGGEGGGRGGMVRAKGGYGCGRWGRRSGRGEVAAGGFGPKSATCSEERKRRNKPV